MEYARLVDLELSGAIFSRGTTLLPPGRPPPRVVETPAGMLNAVGLQNPGVEAVVREKAPIWARRKVPVVVNLAGETDRRLHRGGAGPGRFARHCRDPARISRVRTNPRGWDDLRLRSGDGGRGDPRGAGACSLPLIVKLTPNVTDIRPIAAAVEEAGADAITLINTLLGMSIDLEQRRPFLGNITGGLSGPAIKPVAVRMVYQAAAVVSIPIIGAGRDHERRGCGGISLAGATAVISARLTSRSRAPSPVFWTT